MLVFFAVYVWDGDMDVIGSSMHFVSPRPSVGWFSILGDVFSFVPVQAISYVIKWKIMFMDIKKTERDKPKQYEKHIKLYCAWL
jgi:hypothetical protein